MVAAACGIVVASLYYAQPLIGPISHDLLLSRRVAGFIVTLTQMGYAVGLLLVVPLGDRVENRRLIAGVLSVCVASLAVAGLAASAPLFLAACLCIGLGSVAVQILVPYAAHLAPEATRGKTVGTVMSGLMLGILIARPASSLIAFYASWHSVFLVSAGAVLALTVVLGLALPPRHPGPSLAYGALLASMGRLLVTTPILQRRAAYHAFLFAAFSLFWTAVPLLLASPVYHFTQQGIAFFALAGVGGAISAPIAGRMADRGLERPGTLLAMLFVAVALAVAWFGRSGGPGGLTLLIVSAILLDFGVTANLVIGQRAIFALAADVRSRLNGLYMAIFFVGGATGSAAGAWAFAQGGWTLTLAIGIALPIVALSLLATELPGRRAGAT